MRCNTGGLMQPHMPQPRREPGSFPDHAIMIEVMNAEMCPGDLVRHVHVAGDRCGPQPDLRIGELKTAARARQRNVEWLAGKLVDLRPAPAAHDAGYLYPCGSHFLVGFEINRQEQCLAELRAGRREYGE